MTVHVIYAVIELIIWMAAGKLIQEGAATSFYESTSYEEKVYDALYRGISGLYLKLKKKLAFSH